MHACISFPQGPNSVTKELELMESQLHLEYQHDAADRMGAATTIWTAAEKCARVRESTDSERLRQASGGHRIRTGRRGTQAARYGSRVKLMNNPSAPLRFVLVARIFIHLEGRERTLRRCAQLTEVRG